MNSKQITIDISENGECSINGEGFKGPECEKFIHEIQKEIGSVEVSARKPEYNAIINKKTTKKEKLRKG